MYFDNSTGDATTTLYRAVIEKVGSTMPAANRSAGFTLEDVHPGFET